MTSVNPSTSQCNNASKRKREAEEDKKKGKSKQHPIPLNECPCVTLDEPQEVGYYSVHSDGSVHYDRSQMRKYVKKLGKVRLDLNSGIEKFSHENLVNYDVAEHHNRMLRCIAYKKFEVLKGVHFVGSRAVFKNLLCAPYAKENKFSVCASWLDDVIYLKLVEEENEQLLSEREIRMIAWGFKFEDYMTADSSDGVPNITPSMSEMEKYHVLVKNKIGKHVLLMRAEVDGIEESIQKTAEDTDTSCYVEMKTHKWYDPNKVYDPNKAHIYKNKELSLWAQSHLVGIPKIVVGFKDNEGIVQCIKEYDTNSLADNLSPEKCHSYMNGFLNLVKQHLENDHKFVHEIKLEKDNCVFLPKMTAPEEKYRVIPDWYAEELERHKQSQA